MNIEETEEWMLREIENRENNTKHNIEEMKRLIIDLYNHKTFGITRYKMNECFEIISDNIYMVKIYKSQLEEKKKLETALTEIFIEEKDE